MRKWFKDYRKKKPKRLPALVFVSTRGDTGPRSRNIWNRKLWKPPFFYHELRKSDNWDGNSLVDFADFTKKAAIQP